SSTRRHLNRHRHKLRLRPSPTTAGSSVRACRHRARVMRSSPSTTCCTSSRVRSDSYTPRVPEERKLVSVLFADTVGSTALGAEHDPELVRSTMARYFERM